MGFKICIKNEVNTQNQNDNLQNTVLCDILSIDIHNYVYSFSDSNCISTKYSVIMHTFN
jgi:hypothetical protein